MNMGLIAVQFAVALVLLGGAAAVGFAIARQRYTRQNESWIAVLSGEAAKLRRRAKVAEDRARAAENALTRERRKARR
ncbi:hypothetical protein [uncultured Tateyamaria sp.]|uniref:hypothetical protein n=1 Tax=uncultured Tateyamaria sp. TaxID=455651 RepID=UPI002606FB6F|nr:hypothetical protein [uncultured Tateyamaria sp.]